MRCRICKGFEDVPFGDTCTECMEEMTLLEDEPEYEPPDSEDMPKCDLREEEH